MFADSEYHQMDVEEEESMSREICEPPTLSLIPEAPCRVASPFFKSRPA
jgi:hypothetical protein